jgi:cytidylate kinase
MSGSITDNIIKIAVDGPSGAGKSTVARIAGARLGVEYIDTGAMYRAIALAILRAGISPLTDAESLSKLLAETNVDLKEGATMLGGEDVSGLIRTPEVTKMASDSSALPPVREKLVALQREIGKRKSVIMDGRDIGSNVFPDAQYKFYVTASAEERANRRYKEMKEAGLDADYEDILAAINERDYNDSHRALNPLVKTEDAILIDTTDLTIEQAVEALLSHIPNTVILREVAGSTAAIGSEKNKL